MFCKFRNSEFSSVKYFYVCNKISCAEALKILNYEPTNGTKSLMRAVLMLSRSGHPHTIITDEKVKEIFITDFGVCLREIVIDLVVSNGSL